MRIDDGPLRNGLPPIHPGESLVDDLVEMGLSTGEFAGALAVPEPYFKALLQCDEDITAEMALRLDRYLGVGAGLWMNLQNSFELRLAELQLGEEIEKEVQSGAGADLIPKGSLKPAHVDEGLFDKSRSAILPGKRLADVLETMGMSPEELDAALAVPSGTAATVIRGRSPITAELALRLSHYFNTAARFWINLQSSYDLKVVLRESGAKIKKQVQPRPGIPSPSEDWED